MSTNDGTPGATANQTVQPGRRGRPRSAPVRVAVVRAAAQLTRSGGPAAATIDAIAKRAAVSRTTIYKWWPSSAAIVLDGLLDSVADPILAPPGSTSKEALDHHLRALNAIVCDTRTAPLLRDVVAAAASDPELARAVYEQWLHPRRAAVAATVRQAVAHGEIHQDTDVDMMVDALISPPYYRLLFALPPLNDAALTDLLETVWRGCRRSDALP